MHHSKKLKTALQSGHNELTYNECSNKQYLGSDPIITMTKALQFLWIRYKYYINFTISAECQIQLL